MSCPGIASPRSQRDTLQTREVVLPAKDSAVQDWIASQARTAQREVFAPGQASLIDSPQPMLGDAATTVRPELVEGQAWVNRPTTAPRSRCLPLAAAQVHWKWSKSPLTSSSLPIPTPEATGLPRTWR
ncbi:MAG: hypothetical protein JZU64_13070 [Rhodoferax sp.]|nr:hypothetical protein [Rhodoferax sp.]